MKKLSDNQRTLLDFARSNNGIISKKQACELISYFNNTEKYVSEILTRMVRQNIFKRIARGQYQVSTGIKQDIKIENQTELEL